MRQQREAKCKLTQFVLSSLSSDDRWLVVLCKMIGSRLSTSRGFQGIPGFLNKSGANGIVVLWGALHHFTNEDFAMPIVTRGLTVVLILAAVPRLAATQVVFGSETRPDNLATTKKNAPVEIRPGRFLVSDLPQVRAYFLLSLTIAYFAGEITKVSSESFELKRYRRSLNHTA